MIEDRNAATAQGRPTLLDVDAVKMVYSSAHRTVEALGGVRFTVGDGEFVCIVGPSGAGKTTLLKCISGLLRPTGGTVRLEGTEVKAPPQAMALVFQDYARSLFPWMTVEANVELPLKQAGMARRQRRDLISSALADVGLTDVGSAYPWQLSGGMQQRVAIARAIAYRPRILVMDEPFAAVDAQTRADLEDLVRDLWHKLGVTVLFVTHDIDEAIYLGERVLALSASPTVVMDDIAIDLPDARDQIGTRSLSRFGELRKELYGQIQRARHTSG
ncbi:ABC transporter ATP-binding protein [Pararhizobium mangrovi]|uniref:ABC transporter ATP-binding protein n=1 Tax=Pararhizobium mangrovi TaxID=2590452 RepID=A0A506U7T9_9HYPH|nr:ABC transporter ATP-binding protein [Pararhizobium mangrovi]TPW30413.1 ABC transporter ATP-binding protein [Pararhizobium mangrovi]